MHKELKLVERTPREDSCVVPGPVLDLESVFSKAIDGPAKDKKSPERTCRHPGLSQHAGPFILTLAPIELCRKGTATCAWQLFLTKMQANPANSGRTMET